MESNSIFNLNSSEHKTIISIFVIFLMLIFLIISVSKNVNLVPYELCDKNELCLYNLILDTNNSSLCEYSQDKNLCYKQTALDFKNPLLCNNTNNISHCKINLAIKFKDSNICTTLNNQTIIDNCYFQISTYTLNESICNFASDVSRCYYSYALFTKNQTICNKTNSYKKLCTNKLLNQSK
jgi:hypothetical protein